MSHEQSAPDVSPEVWRSLSRRLVATLKPFDAPVAISFLRPGQSAPAARLSDQPAPPNEGGRTGQVSAGCVYWIRGATDTFATDAADHGNCSVGSYTHGFLSLADAASQDDVKAVLESGWVNQGALLTLPYVAETPGSIVYGPLADSTVAPDVVLLRINGFALMTLKGALPAMRIEGKPQCHIVALAKEHGEITASVGCALSRARTGMRPDEMTCAIPGRRLGEVVDALEEAAALDRALASYAVVDAQRFR